MSQRARALILASVGGITGAASALATEAILKVAAFILLILGSALAIGTAIAAGRSDPAETVVRCCRLQLVASRLKDVRETFGSRSGPRLEHLEERAEVTHDIRADVGHFLFRRHGRLVYGFTRRYWTQGASPYSQPIARYYS
jgi:hypothetical protein